MLHNVLLTDELLSPQTTYASASIQPSQQNGVYAWNLGDIPPLSSITVTLQLTIPNNVLDFTEFDTGTTAWGTLQGQAVYAQAAPISLAPDGFGGWLQCTIDANCDDGLYY